MHMAPADADFIGMRNRLEADMYRVFGVPTPMLRTPTR